jgi:hypothetical protein
MDKPVKPSWWSRNWKWFVPAGCLGLLVLSGASVIGLVSLLFAGMKSSDVYQDALARARQHPALVQALGGSVEARWWLSGSVSVSGPSGTADIAIPLRGPSGSATLYVVAEKSAGQWRFTTLEAQVAGAQERINLLAREPERDAPASRP